VLPATPASPLRPTPPRIISNVVMTTTRHALALLLPQLPLSLQPRADSILSSVMQSPTDSWYRIHSNAS
jgi:hypothetical protein